MSTIASPTAALHLPVVICILTGAVAGAALSIDRPGYPDLRTFSSLLSSYILRDKIYCVTMAAMTRSDERRSIERELKRGSLELIVLHLLGPGEAYGYEIVSKLTEQTNGALEVTDGTLYPVLYRLERAGYVAVRWESP